MIAILLYHSIALCTYKGDISASAICHVWGLYGILGSLTRLPIATVVACPATFHSALLHRGYSQ